MGRCIDRSWIEIGEEEHSRVPPADHVLRLRVEEGGTLRVTEAAGGLALVPSGVELLEREAIERILQEDEEVLRRPAR